MQNGISGSFRPIAHAGEQARQPAISRRPAERALAQRVAVHDQDAPARDSTNTLITLS